MIETKLGIPEITALIVFSPIIVAVIAGVLFVGLFCWLFEKIAPRFFWGDMWEFWQKEQQYVEKN